MVKREMLKRFGEAVDATLDGAVVDVVADFDTKPTEELWFEFVFDGEFVAVVFGETCDDFLALGIGQRDGAFNDDRAAGLLETREALDRSKDRLEIAWFSGDEFGNQIPQLVVIKLAVHLAQAEETASGGSGDFGNFHRCLV